MQPIRKSWNEWHGSVGIDYQANDDSFSITAHFDTIEIPLESLELFSRAIANFHMWAKSERIRQTRTPENFRLTFDEAEKLGELEGIKPSKKLRRLLEVFEQQGLTREQRRAVIFAMHEVGSEKV